MIAKALSSDFLKIRGKGLWLLAFIGPVGLIAMQALNFGIRYDYLTKQYADDLWGGLLNNILQFVPVSLFLGITLISSLLANIEHGLSSWKQLLALPVSRFAVFGAKFMVCVLLLAFSCVLLSCGTAVLGLSLKFEAELPVGDMIRLSLYPFIASMPILAFMLWLCLTYKNQALPITVGVVLSVLSLIPISEWLPLSWPLLAYTGPTQAVYLTVGIVSGLLILLLGSLHFNQKDVS